MDANGIHQEVVTVSANKGTLRMEATTMIKALGAILDRTKHPILVHCNKGKVRHVLHRTLLLQMF